MVIHWSKLTAKETEGKKEETTKDEEESDGEVVSGDDTGGDDDDVDDDDAGIDRTIERIPPVMWPTRKGRYSKTSIPTTKTPLTARHDRVRL